MTICVFTLWYIYRKRNAASVCVSITLINIICVMFMGSLWQTMMIILRPRQNVQNFADDIFKCIFSISNIYISHKTSCFMSGLVPIMAWYQTSYKPLSDPMTTQFTDSYTYMHHPASISMMTSSNGNISALLDICAGNSPVPGEFPAQRPVTRSFDAYFRCAWIKCWVNNREAGNLRCHCAHYDVTVMLYNVIPLWPSKTGETQNVE